MSCSVCGAACGTYTLCFKCNKLKEEGKVVKCPDCGTWHYTDKPCKCKGSTIESTTPTTGRRITFFRKPAEETATVKSEETAASVTAQAPARAQASTPTPTPTPTPAPTRIPPKPAEAKPAAKGNGVCIVCGKAAPSGHLCRDCWYEMRDYRESFDKNAKAFDMKDYYFNLRSNIYRMKSFDYIKSNCNKLMAIANFLFDYYKDTSLVDRVVGDITDIIEAKKPKEPVKVSEEVRQKDSHKEELRRTSDGHYVKSDPEVTIDDILYEARIVHCYEKKVPIDSDEQTIKCDWFIPVTDSRHGIYIEYWGMNTKDYLQNKERKRKAYREHNIPLIEIEKDDYKDRQGLADRIISEINKLARIYFNITNYLQ